MRVRVRVSLYGCMHLLVCTCRFEPEGVKLEAEPRSQKQLKFFFYLDCAVHHLNLTNPTSNNEDNAVYRIL